MGDAIGIVFLVEGDGRLGPPEPCRGSNPSLEVPSSRIQMSCT
jgi:hypothetical protein